MRDDSSGEGSTATPPTRSGTLHLLYHQLCRDPHAYRYTLSVEQFTKHLGLFARLQQDSGGLRPAITFDDGHASDVELALPLLDEHGLKAAFFITAGWTGTQVGYMNQEQLRTLHAAGHTIGAHGWSHTLFTACSPAQLRQELYAARALLEDTIGAPVQTLSFPGGRYSRAVVEACRTAGYTRLYTSNPAVVPAEEKESLIGRLNLLGDTSAEWLRRLFAPDGSLLRSLQRADRAKRAAKVCLGDTLYAALWRRLNHAEADA